MKNIFILFTSILLSMKIYGQVGINTINPQGVLHIDSNGDNSPDGNISTDQMKDDVVITSNGDIGIGTLTPKAKIEINSTDSGLLLSRLTNIQRDSIPLGRAETGMMIYNIDLAKIQVNSGTDQNRVWSNLESTSSTINTSIAYTSTTSQTINYASGYQLVSFDTILFDNAPTGFVVRNSTNNSFTLAPGKIYKIDANMGRLNSSDSNHTWCQIVDDTLLRVLSSVSILPNSLTTSNWNTFNTMLAYINTIDRTSDTVISLKCSKQNAGNIVINSGIAPILTFTIMN